MGVPAFDGEEALEVMGREHIDFIISDIMMPKYDKANQSERDDPSGQGTFAPCTA